MQIPFFKPEIGVEEQTAVQSVLESGWLTTGKMTRQFEAEFAAYVGAKHAIAVSSCPAALHGGLVMR